MSARHLYVHVPFCARRCAYCDFSIAVRRNVPVAEYLLALDRELSLRTEGSSGTGSANRHRRNRNGSEFAGQLDTLYFGGGTPSRLGPAGVAEMMRIIRAHYDIAATVEVTLEANPEDVTTDAAAAWVAAGITRLSIGVQSFDDDVLRWMHRVHTAEQSELAVDAARGTGIPNISLDLIFALPPEIERDWADDLERTFSLAPAHVSLYGLTIEPATPLARWTERGQTSAPDDNRYADEFLLASRVALAAGYRHYEVSNFARAGQESRHNSAYWNGAAYLGVGPSAHSFDGRTRSWNVAPYAAWAAALARGVLPVSGSEVLSHSSRAAERTYLGLRTADGYFAGDRDIGSARSWAASGWAVVEGRTIRLTPEGWLRLDSLAAGLTGV